MCWEPWFQAVVINYEKNGTNKSLAAQMCEDASFMALVEQGKKDIEEGRFSSLEDVKKRLGDD